MMTIGDYDFVEKANLKAEMAVVSNQVSDYQIDFCFPSMEMMFFRF